MYCHFLLVVALRNIDSTNLHLCFLKSMGKIIAALLVLFELALDSCLRAFEHVPMHFIARQITTLQLLHISTAVLLGFFIKEMQEHSYFILTTSNMMECQWLK